MSFMSFLLLMSIMLISISKADGRKSSRKTKHHVQQHLRQTHQNGGGQTCCCLPGVSCSCYSGSCPPQNDQTRQKQCDDKCQEGCSACLPNKPVSPTKQNVDSHQNSATHIEEYYPDYFLRPGVCMKQMKTEKPKNEQTKTDENEDEDAPKKKCKFASGIFGGMCVPRAESAEPEFECVEATREKGISYNYMNLHGHMQLLLIIIHTMRV